MQQLLKEALELIEEMLDDKLTLNNYLYRARFKRLKNSYNKLTYDEQWMPSDVWRTRCG